LRKREEDYPSERPSMKKVGLLLLILLGITTFWFLDGYFSEAEEEEEIDCDPELENCDRLKIIVRFIVINQQLITNT